MARSRTASTVRDTASNRNIIRYLTVPRPRPRCLTTPRTRSIPTRRTRVDRRVRREAGMAAGSVKVAQVRDVPEGQARVVEAGGRTLALFNVGGTFYALDNDCAHRGGPLGEGDLEGRIV